MKNWILIILSLASFKVYADCNSSETEEHQDVVYEVSKDMPKYMQGAKITVRLANGTESTVPAEKFMVVPRKQKTVVGQNTKRTHNLVCYSSSKNTVMVEGRKDITGHEVSTHSVPGGQQAEVHSVKEFVPGVDYYRRQLFDTNFGAGAGIDTNGTIKGMIGVDF